MSDQPESPDSIEDAVAGSKLDAFVALAAFNGAVIGLVGCLAGALGSDTIVSLVAGLGAATCGWLWKVQLIDSRVIAWRSQSGEF